MHSIVYFYILFIYALVYSESVDLKQIFFNSTSCVAKDSEGADAIDLFETLCLQEPHNPLHRFNYASALLSIGNMDKAIEQYDKAYQLNPSMIAALYNKGYVLKCKGQFDEAIAIYKKVIAQDPTYDAAHLALGFAYIAQGNFQNGWKQHTLYLKRAGKNGDRLRTFLAQQDIHNKTILLMYEGGLGDTLQFIRYAQRLKKMGATTIACVQKCLHPLLAGCPWIDKLIDKDSPLPFFDAHCSLLSFPAVFNDNEETFPKEVPYLFIDNSIIDVWKPSFDPNYFNIGIYWQPNVKNDESRLAIARRGIPLEEFIPLAHIPLIRLYSLQQEDGLDQIQEMPSHFDIHIFDATFDTTQGSFMDTGAVMHHLDLIITTDSAVAHLAGALNRPVWLLLPFSTDWRWIYDRDDSPWYPSMRIFKQPAPFDWHSVMNQVKHELGAMIAHRN